MLLPFSNTARSALLVIDMQAFFFQQEERRRLLPATAGNINCLIGHFEAQSWPVVHVVSGYLADGSDWDIKMKAAGVPELIVGTPEAAILPQIDVREHHLTVRKTRYSAFFKTGLAEELARRGVERVVVVGAYTHYCVNATIFDAFAHDFVPCLIVDAVISHLPKEAEIMIDRMRRNGYHVFSTQEFIGLERPE